MSIYLWMKEEKEFSQAVICLAVSWTHLIVRQRYHFLIFNCQQPLLSHILRMSHCILTKIWVLAGEILLKVHMCPTYGAIWLLATGLWWYASHVVTSKRKKQKEMLFFAKKTIYCLIGKLKSHKQYACFPSVSKSYDYKTFVPDYIKKIPCSYENIPTAWHHLLQRSNSNSIPLKSASLICHDVYQQHFHGISQAPFSSLHLKQLPGAFVFCLFQCRTNDFLKEKYQEIICKCFLFCLVNYWTWFGKKCNESTSVHVCVTNT